MSILKNAHALLIGIEYEDGLNTIGDAMDVADVLTDETLCGYPKDNVVLLTGENADRNGILKAFDDLIARTDEDSSIFLYYSGHGDVIENIFHFVPYGIVEGMTLEEYSKAWVTADDIKEKINQLATKRLIFFMDCCHATGMALGGFSTKKSAKTSKKKTSKKSNFEKLEGLAQKVDTERGISIVASCKEEQESYQLDDDRNSLFTKHLLLALKGQHQDHFVEPYVRILEVASYLLKVIPPIIKNIADSCDPPLEIRQEPYVNLEMYDNFVLSYIPEALRTPTSKKPTPISQSKSPESESQWVFRETEGANNLILFINGFTGEGAQTFGELPGFLIEDEHFLGWDMKPFGYSKFVQPEFGKHIWGGIKDIDRICNYLCTSVKYKFEKYDRIAIVAHGFGGLVAQRALLDFEERFRKKISHLILLGCPNNGIAQESIPPSELSILHEITDQGSFIKNLRKDWELKFGASYPFSLRVVGATGDEFVSSQSNFTPFQDELCSVVEGNHFSLVKPGNVDDTAYHIIKNTLTFTENYKSYGNREEINLALGKYDALVKELLPQKDDLDQKGITYLIFALEGLDRREEALSIIENHPELTQNTDFMGIVGGRYKRNYLKLPKRSDGEAALVYYGLALEQAQANKDQEQIYYLAINMAFLHLVINEDIPTMRKFAFLAKSEAEKSQNGLWKFATLGEAAMYLDDLEIAKNYYTKAASVAGVREKISIHLNASVGYAHLINDTHANFQFQEFLKEMFLS
ncbi:caspase family protein [Maribacter sp. CXY002]|uniref:caspase family protein n=1 Tax=Maribacter luteocoastalis TaxID=3407671 RepID=UPI003B670A04